jgi:hypothetical protein
MSPTVTPKAEEEKFQLPAGNCPVVQCPEERINKEEMRHT